MAIVELATPRNLRARSYLSDEELETLVQIGAEQGALQHAEGEMIQEVFKLGDKTAKDVLTPRVDMFALPDDLTNEDATAQLKTRRHRRVPVYADSPTTSSALSKENRFRAIRKRIPTRPWARHHSFPKQC